MSALETDIEKLCFIYQAKVTVLVTSTLTVTKIELINEHCKGFRSTE